MLAGLGGLPLTLGLGSGLSHAATSGTARSHAISLMGDVKYPSNFTHFDDVNPRAPKGGRIRLTAISGFDSLNPFIVQGTAARGILSVYDTLMKASFDEAATLYPLVAREVEFAANRRSIIFHLNPEARFHDARAVTSADVVFSFNILKENGHPQFRNAFRDVSGAKAIGRHAVQFTFSTAQNRELPVILAQMIYVLPRHHWEGGAREFDRSSLAKPLGSGPYRVARLEPGRFVEYHRVKDYWARDLPSNVGQNNFDVVRYDFYFDVEVALTAFLAGTADVRVDMNPKSWATRYKVPQVESGRIKRVIIPDDLPNGMKGLFFNLRLPKFQDVRIREALILAFDFEWANRHLLYGSRKRLNSYFANSTLAATGIPDGAEARLLRRFAAQLPKDLFLKPYRCPITKGDGNNRVNLRRAMTLFQEAGYHVVDGFMVSRATGQAFTIEFLLDEPGLERIVQNYITDLEKIGVRGSIRVVDPAQYQNRLEQFDFDMTSDWQRVSLSPGNELRDLFGSEGAARPGSGNIAGLKSPVVDALIERIVAAPDRQSLVVATRALDRVLMWQQLCVPQWYLGGFPCAYWDRFGLPEGQLHLDGLPATWWEKQASMPRGGQ